MKKKHPKVTTPVWLKNALIGIIIVPILAFSWHNIQAIWASPEKLESVSKQVEKHETAQETLARLVVEQQSRLDKQEAVYQANLESTKEQLNLIAELKGRKK